MLLTLHAGPRRDAQPLGLGKQAFGYEVDALVHGTLPLEEESGEVFSSRPQTALDLVGGIEPQSVCGTLGYENVACHPEIGAAQRPVARLLAVSGGSRSVRCTGWLVAGSNANTLVTNNHCFSTAAAVRSVEAQFNYQFTTCNGTTTATTTSFRGQTLLRTVGQPLDYTLLTLDGGESLFGEVIPSRRRAVVGERIWLIQHPAGQRKKIGFWRDAGHTNPCTVQAVTSSQVQYNCDTEGGSSGSVVLAPPSATTPTARAIGLHHLGGCPNSAAQMQLICNSAGALLQCQ